MTGRHTGGTQVADPGSIREAETQAVRERGALAPWQLQLVVLQAQAEDLRALANASQATFLDVYYTHVELKARVAQRWPNPKQIREGTDDWALLKAREAELVALAAREAALAKRRDGASEKSRAAASLVANAERFLTANRQAIIAGTLALPGAAAAAEPPSRAAVDVLRAKIAATAKALADLDRHPATSGERLAAIGAAVDGAARRYLDFAGAMPRARPGGKVDLTVGIPLYREDLIRGALCAFAGPAVTDALVAAAEAAQGDLKPMSASDIARRGVELADEILELERAEELIIRSLAEEGTDIQRRPDASPLAVLAP
jgi:hypothetical protein